MRRLLLVAFVIATLATGLRAQGRSLESVLDRLSVGGTYLGLFNAFHQDERAPADPVRAGFDFATNLDLGWRLSDRVSLVAQLQGGTGGGEIGFQGPDLLLTDINLQVVLPFEDSEQVEALEFVIGSFDTPFGEQTGAQSNNADLTANPMILNSLLYSVLGGTVGTLNTLGVMGALHTTFADFTGAITNGTDESATNPDGNLEFVLSAGTDFGGSDIRAVGSFIASDDRDASGSSGFGADLTGVLGELKYEPNEQLRIKGYVGNMTFGDGIGVTEDNVVVWMGEARFARDRWHLAGRLSGWIPDDRDGSRTGVSTVLPNPGFAVARLGFLPDTDQEIRRLQIGAGLGLGHGLTLRSEFMIDDYKQPTAGRSTDVVGLMIGLLGVF